jgi:hypothetical protein
MDFADMHKISSRSTDRQLGIADSKVLVQFDVDISLQYLRVATRITEQL